MQQDAQAGAGVRVEVCDAAGRKVDAVAAQEPLALRALGQLPDERASFDGRLSEMRLVASMS